MSILLPYIHISLFVLFLVILFKKKYEVCLPLSLFITVLISYIGGFFGNVKSGYYFNIFVSLISIIVFIYKRKDFKETFKNYFSLGFFVFLLLYLIFNIFHRYSFFSYWDEFMHWGPMVSETNRLNAFYSVNESALMVHKDYPPFSSLLENLWCSYVGSYAENSCFRALSVFSVALIMPFFKNLKYSIKNIFKSLIIVVIFVLINIFNYVEFRTLIDTIYIDFLLGLLGMYCIYSSLELVENQSIFNYMNLSLSLISILLLKQMGIAFYLLSVFVILVGAILNKNKIEIKRNLIYFLALVIILPLFLIGMWNNYISNFDNISAQFSVGQFSIKSFIDILFNGVGKDWQLVTLNNFFVAISTSNLIVVGNLGLSFVDLVILISFLMLVINFITRDRNSYIVSLAFALGSLGYSFAMLLLYLFSFGSYEGPILASFERYFNTYIYFGFLLILMMLVLYLFKNKKGIYLSIPFVVICLILVNSNYTMLKPRNLNESYLNDKKKIKAFEQIEYNAKQGSNILIISQYQDDLVWVLRYKYIDRNFEVISVGDPKYEGDILSKKYSLDEWKDLLKKYDYIYIYSSDDDLFKNYWEPITNTEMWDEYMYKFKDNNICRVVDAGECEN